MPDKCQNKYRIPSARLPAWDYSRNAAYFITICTAKRQHYFGEIINREMQLSETGRMAYRCWQAIPDHFPSVFLDAFVVMPNHTHGIIIIDKPGNDGRVVGNNAAIENGTVVETRHALSLPSNPQRPTKKQQRPPEIEPEPQQSQHLNLIEQPRPRFRNQGKNTISAMIGSFKSAVTKWCNENKLPFGWQTRFHDHIIRNNDEFWRIRNYIVNNETNWTEDKFFSS